MTEAPFSYRVTVDGRVFIARDSRTVRVVARDRGKRLAVALAAAGPDRRQQLLAVATGNYRRGNEQ